MFVINLIYIILKTFKNKGKHNKEKEKHLRVKRISCWHRRQKFKRNYSIHWYTFARHHTTNYKKAYITIAAAMPIPLNAGWIAEAAPWNCD